VSRELQRDLPSPQRAGSLLERPELEARLDTAFGKRLTTVIAGAGYGRTTLLAQWSRDIECAWYAVAPGW